MKTLIAYYSQSGQTKRIAEQIAVLVDNCLENFYRFQI